MDAIRVSTLVARTPDRVFVVDDQADIRDLLETTLTSHGFDVETFDCAAAFLDSDAAGAKGCVLSDIQMPDMDGLALQQELNRRGARLGLVIMAGQGVVSLAVEAMKAGAVDFLQKPFKEAVLLDCVRRALELVSSASASASLTHAARTRIARLTRREKQVFELVVRGDTNKIIAYKLGISPRTVEIYRGHITAKLGAHSVAELVRLSIASAPSGSAGRETMATVQ
jgi:two-component system response regulator FixJ